MLLDAKKALAQGRSPALEKQREKRRLTAAKNFGDMAVRWLADAKLADSTRAMRKHVVDRDILAVLQNCAARSNVVLPSRYDADRCMSKATLNPMTQLVDERAKAAGLPLAPFTVHDLRRTGAGVGGAGGCLDRWPHPRP